MKNTVLCFLMAVLVAGCGPSGPPSTDITSEAFGSLAEKTSFLKQYVTFDRPYETVDFAIVYHNNSGGLIPGPSDWDIRIIAQVPQGSLSDWLPDAGAEKPHDDRIWLTTVPTTMACSGITQWFQAGHTVVGVDRARSIVAYRNTSR